MRKFGAVLKEAVGDSLQNAGAEIGAEMQRMGTQGANELASALFNGSAFVQYGAGQYTPDVNKEGQEQGKEGNEGQGNEGKEEQERGGREM